MAAANRHDWPLLRPTLETLGLFEICFGIGLPDRITAHLDAGYDSAKPSNLLDDLGCRAKIRQKAFPLQACPRRVVEPADSWHNRGYQKLLVWTKKRDRVLAAFIALATAVVIVRRLIRIAWTTHRWGTRPTRRP